MATGGGLLLRHLLANKEDMALEVIDLTNDLAKRMLDPLVESLTRKRLGLAGDSEEETSRIDNNNGKWKCGGSPDRTISVTCRIRQ